MDVTKRTPSICTNPDGSIWNNHIDYRSVEKKKEPGVGEFTVVSYGGPPKSRLGYLIDPMPPVTSQPSQINIPSDKLCLDIQKTTICTAVIEGSRRKGRDGGRQIRKERRT